MLRLLLIILFISHWGACFWYYLGVNEQESSGVSWIDKAGLINTSIYEKYVTSLYFFITTMSTVIFLPNIKRLDMAISLRILLMKESLQ